MKTYKRYSTHYLKSNQSLNKDKLFSENSIKEKVKDVGDT